MKRNVPVLDVTADVCETFLERARGLIGRPAPAAGHGLLIPKCNAIHTWFMRYPIDVRFLDANGKVVRKVKDIRPWRLLVWGGWRAKFVLETASKAVVVLLLTAAAGCFSSSIPADEAIAALEGGDPLPALRWTRELAEDEGESVALLRESGRIRMLRGEFVEAERCFRVAMSSSGSGGDMSRLYLLMAEIFRGRYFDAVADARRVAQEPDLQGDGNAVLRWLAAMVLENVGYWDRSRALYRRLGSEFKNNAVIAADAMRAEVGVRYPRRGKSRVLVVYEEGLASKGAGAYRPGKVLVALGGKPTAASAIADVRSQIKGSSWMTLPSGQQVWEAGLAEPGEVSLQVKNGDRSLSVPLTLAANETRVVWIADTGSAFYHAVSPGIQQGKEVEN